MVFIAAKWCLGMCLCLLLDLVLSLQFFSLNMICTKASITFSFLIPQILLYYAFKSTTVQVCKNHSGLFLRQQYIHLANNHCSPLFIKYSSIIMMLSSEDDGINFLVM